MDDALKPSQVRKKRRPLPSYLPRDVGGRYRILSLLGSGACGDVVEAFDMQARDLVALKLLRTERVSERLVKRFFREAEAMGRVKHPGVVEIRGCGTDSHGVHYLAMELVRGRSLRELMRDRGGCLSPWEVARVAIDVCEVLQVAHGMGVIHRDMKPGNLIVPDGWPDDADPIKVVDFGVAKVYGGDEDNPMTQLTQSGESLGTPHYMAPEQAHGRAVDGRADLYGLGCVLYHALCGHRPIDGDNPFAVLMAHLERKPTSLVEVLGPRFAPPALSGLIDRLLAKRPEDRPPDAAAVAAELRPILNRLTREAAPRPDVSPNPNEPGTFSSLGRALQITSGSAIPASTGTGPQAPPDTGPQAPPRVQEVGVKHLAAIATSQALPAAKAPAPAPPPRGGLPTAVWIAAGVGLLLLLAVGAAAGLYVATRGSAPPTSDPAPAAQPRAASSPERPARADLASAAPASAAATPAPPEEAAPTPQGPLRVSLASTPRGAAIIRNGLEVGRTPLTVELARPLHAPAVFLLVAPERQAEAVVLRPAEVNDKASLVIERDLIPLDNGNATLEIHTSPPGAQVRLGERLMGITPVAIQQPLRKQTVRLVLEAEGKEPREVVLGLRREAQVVRIPLDDASDPVPEVVAK